MASAELVILYAVNKGHRETLSTKAIKNRLNRAFWSFTGHTCKWVICDHLQEIEDAFEDGDAPITLAFLPEAYAKKMQDLRRISSAILPGLSRLEIIPDGTCHNLDVFFEGLRPILPVSMRVADDWHKFHINIDLWGGGMMMRDWILKKRNVQIDDVPTSTEHAMHPDRKDCVVITSPAPPFSVIFTNKNVEATIGFTFHDLAGESLKCLQGPATDLSDVLRFMQSIKKEHAAKETFLNYQRDKSPVHLTSRVSALTESGDPRDEIMGLVALMSVSAVENADPAATAESATTAMPAGLDQSSRSIEPFPLLHAVDYGSQPTTSSASSAGEPANKKLKLLSLPDQQLGIHPQIYPSFFKPDAIIVTLKNRPFSIVHVNKAWETLCKYTSNDVIGKDPSVLQGQETDFALVQSTVACAQAGNVATMLVKNYKKGEAQHFMNQVTIAEIPNSPFMIARLVEKTGQKEGTRCGLECTADTCDRHGEHVT
jgi:hypothetical protein